MSRMLFCWEVGEGSGHVVPYLSLIEALRTRGWDVAVAARNTAEVGARVQASGATLFQAPVCLGIFPEMDESSFNATELLLQHGYGYEPIFDGMFSSWLALLRLWKPDLVIGSHAPTAHLAAQCLSIPDVAIGSGFDCPIATDPAPLIRPWQPGIEQRIAASEDRARQTVNSVLLKHGFVKRQFAQDMYAALPTLLCTLPELDYFRTHRGPEATYIGSLLSVAPGKAENAPEPGGRHEIFVYLRYSQAIDNLFSVLAKRPRPSLIYMPNLTPTQKTKLEAKYGAMLHFAASAVDIRQVLLSAKLIISNAGHNLTLQCLLAGVPLLLLPTHGEQSVIADLAVSVGAAIKVLPTELYPKYQRRIDELLDKPSYRDAAQEFVKRHEHSTALGALEQAVHICEQRAELNFTQSRLTAVG